jgi:hypothetical protein
MLQSAYIVSAQPIFCARHTLHLLDLASPDQVEGRQVRNDKSFWCSPGRSAPDNPGLRLRGKIGKTGAWFLMRWGRVSYCG